MDPAPPPVLDKEEVRSLGTPAMGRCGDKRFCSTGLEGKGGTCDGQEGGSCSGVLHGAVLGGCGFESTSNLPEGLGSGIMFLSICRLASDSALGFVGASKADMVMVAYSRYCRSLKVVRVCLQPARRTRRESRS